MAVNTANLVWQTGLVVTTMTMHLRTTMITRTTTRIRMIMPIPIPWFKPLFKFIRTRIHIHTRMKRLINMDMITAMIMRMDMIMITPILTTRVVPECA